MTNPMGLNLTYVRVDPTTDNPDDYPPQPVLVRLKGNKTMTKLVPVLPLTPVFNKCAGCVAEDNEYEDESPRINCYELPDCTNTIFVRANPTNLVRYVEWRLENDK